MAPPPPYRRPVLDHLGLVAGMFAARGIGEISDQATQHHPEMRLVTAGHAVNAMGLHGRGCVNPPRSLVPRLFPNNPTSRLITPGITAEPLHDEALGRALATLSADGVTALDRLMAATAAERFGLAPTVAHLDRPSGHVDGRDNRAEAAEAHGMHSTRGSSRDHRPDLHQVMVELSVEHHAGIPLLMKPLRGHSRDAHAVGAVIQQPIPP
jgi:transposase